MVSSDAFTSHTKYCPYCGTKIVRDDNYCVACRRTFVDPPVERSPEQVQPRAMTESRRPWVSAVLSFFGVGLGQFYNGETVKGLALVSLFVAAFLLLPRFIPVNPFFAIFFIWAVAVPDAYLSAKKINQLKKPFQKKSVFFGIEIVVLAILGALILLPVISPDLTGHGISIAARVMEDTKIPGLPVPDYDTALAYAPNDTEIMMEKANYLIAGGKNDEAQVWLDKVILATPNDTTPVILAGDVMCNSGQYQKGLDYYDTALSMNRKDAQVWIKKGDAYLALSIGEMQMIRQQFKGLTSHSPGQSVSSDASTIDAFRSTGSYRLAVKSYNEAIKIDPKTSIEISGRILASTQILLDNYTGILDDMNNDNITSSQTVNMQYPSGM